MRRLLLLSVCVVAGVVAAPAALIYAEVSEEEQREALENRLQAIEKQILRQQVKLEDTRLERRSLERDISILDTQIEKARLGIEARELTIAQLSDQIRDKEAMLRDLEAELRRHQQSVGELMRKTHALDDFSLIELLLNNNSFSDFFDDVEQFRAVNQSLQQSIASLEQVQADTRLQKRALEAKQAEEAEMKQLQQQEKRTIEAKEAQKQDILAETRGQEEAYQAMLERQQKTAAQLRQQLFTLMGGGGAIPFPEAVDLAQYASERSGVSAALILAILEQESAYGSNIGSCTYDEVVRGRPVMHPDRDQPVFRAIGQTLGFDPETQQVSCPWINNGERIGWGGAMGPSQFIPSTWAIYGGIVRRGGEWTYERSEDAIRRLTGSSAPSNPFNNRDAFLATALLMRDNGAGPGTYNAEWTAAIRYFAGWAGANNPVNHPYGDSVMQRKARLAEEIRILEG